MSALTAIRALARGERPAGALLPPCRLEAFGADHYGEEAIVASFRNAPLDLSDKVDVVAAPGHLALFEGDTAIIVDLCGVHAARMWRIGCGDFVETEPAIGVAFDTDLVQARQDVALRAEDHPALAPEMLGAVEDIGRRIAHGWTPEDGAAPWRTRPFLIRAFSAGNDGVALFAVHRIGHGSPRTAGFAYLAARFRVENGALATVRLIRDLAGEAAVASAVWRPRVD